MFTIFDKQEQRIPLKIWMSSENELEEGAFKQAMNLTQLSFAYHHIALMPDAHQGYGMPIGGVLAAEDAIVPNAVGLDIGCGMRAAKTSRLASDISLQWLNLMMNNINRTIPRGFDWHKKPQKHPVFDDFPDHIGILAAEFKNIKHQLGTLGGGNHFIEFQLDSEDNLWIMVHSGSRNIGKKVAEHFHRRAVKSCETRNEPLPTKELSFFKLDSPDGQEYFTAMTWCQKFSRANRETMMHVILDIIGESPRQMIDIHHNYAAPEKHFGKTVVLHRKGAVKADKGAIGVVPGSMGTHSYIIEGLGDPESFNSSAHGAGRRLGRRQARRIIPVETVLRQMEEKGIPVSAANKRELPEEADEAYKDLDYVMHQQRGLVRIITKLHPIAVVKG